MYDYSFKPEYINFHRNDVLALKDVFLEHTIKKEKYFFLYLFYEPNLYETTPLDEEMWVIFGNIKGKSAVKA